MLAHLVIDGNEPMPQLWRNRKCTTMMPDIRMKTDDTAALRRGCRRIAVKFMLPPGKMESVTLPFCFAGYRMERTE